eukprot:681786-Rhodomonas_salina.1
MYHASRVPITTACVSGLKSLCVCVSELQLLCSGDGTANAGDERADVTRAMLAPVYLLSPRVFQTLASDRRWQSNGLAREWCGMKTRR